MKLNHLLGKVSARWQRTSSRLLFQRRLAMQNARPLISFTFDDFPRSAWRTGGAILNKYGVRGSYYAALGLMGQETPTGPMFLPEDIGPMLEQGHELGCHTYDHLDSWTTPTSVFEQSLLKNRTALKAICPKAEFLSLSFPISPPRPTTKRMAGRMFSCSRGGGQIHNEQVADLNSLRAYFLEKSGGRIENVTTLIDRCCQSSGWLILATHDVCENHTAFGCRPDFFEAIVRYAVNSPAQVLIVSESLQALRGSIRSRAGESESPSAVNDVRTKASHQ